jgi:hypothetical protein
METSTATISVRQITAKVRLIGAKATDVDMAELFAKT